MILMFMLTLIRTRNISSIEMKDDLSSIRMKDNLSSLKEYVELERSKKLTKEYIILTCDLLIETKRFKEVYETFLITDFSYYFSGNYLGDKFREYSKYHTLEPKTKMKMGGIFSICVGLGAYCFGYGVCITCPLIGIGAGVVYYFW